MIFIRCKQKVSQIEFEEIFRMEVILKVFFSYGKLFDIDGFYNFENDRAWEPSLTGAKWGRENSKKSKFPQKVTVRLGASSKVVTPLVIFLHGTVDHARCIEDVLFCSRIRKQCFLEPLDVLAWDAKPHINHVIEQCCRHNFPEYSAKHERPIRSSDLNALKSCVRN